MSPFAYLYLGTPIVRKGKLVQPMGGWEKAKPEPLRKPTTDEVLSACQRMRLAITSERISSVYGVEQRQVSTVLGRLARRGILRVTGHCESENGRPALIYRVTT